MKSRGTHLPCNFFNVGTNKKIATRKKNHNLHLLRIGWQLGGLHGDVELRVIDSWRRGEADSWGGKSSLLITKEEGEWVINRQPLTQCHGLGVEDWLWHVNHLHPWLATWLLVGLSCCGKLKGYPEVAFQLLDSFGYFCLCWGKLVPVKSGKVLLVTSRFMRGPGWREGRGLMDY